MTFVRQRLETLRNFYDLTQSELAERAAISHGLVSLFESGARVPTVDVLRALAEALHVTPEFFQEPIKEVWAEAECSFRHRRTTQIKVKRRARAHGTLVGLVIDHLSTLVRFPAYNVPEIAATSDDEVEAAADSCRRHWQLGSDTPILDIGRVLERAGVVIVQHLEHSDKIDAFSRPGRPSVVVLNTAKTSTSRWIYDLAHELGHLVLHRGRETGDEATELQADRFAAAFLLPTRAFAREFRTAQGGQFWENVFALKRRWRVSAQAIVRRAYQLGLIAAIPYRRACKYISAKGWRSGPEPSEPEFKGPEVLSIALSSIETSLGITARHVCEALHMLPETFVRVTGVQPRAAAATLHKIGA